MGRKEGKVSKLQKFEPGVPTNVDVATAKQVAKQAASVLAWTDFGWARLTKNELLEILGQGKTEVVVIKRSATSPGVYCFSRP
jgi:hypothetical protein